VRECWAYGHPARPVGSSRALRTNITDAPLDQGEATFVPPICTSAKNAKKAARRTAFAPQLPMIHCSADLRRRLTQAGQKRNEIMG